MKKLAISAVALLLASCVSTAPMPFSRTTVQPSGEVFDCASSMVNGMGFTVTSSSKDGGLIRAERKTSGLGQAVWLGVNSFDGLTVTIFRDSQSQATTLKVMAESLAEKAIGMGAGHRNGGAPSAALQADAQKIITACAR